MKTKLAAVQDILILGILAILVALLAFAAVAGSPPQAGISATPAPWDQTGLSYSNSVCTTLTSASTTDIDALFSAMTAGERRSVRAMQVTFVDPVSTDAACVAVGQTTLTCSIAASGSAQGVMLSRGAQIRYLLRERESADLPDIVGRSTGTTTVCVEVFR